MVAAILWRGKLYKNRCPDLSGHPHFKAKLVLFLARNAGDTRYAGDAGDTRYAGNAGSARDARSARSASSSGQLSAAFGANSVKGSVVEAAFGALQVSASIRWSKAHFDSFFRFVFVGRIVSSKATFSTIAALLPSAN